MKSKSSLDTMKNYGLLSKNFIQSQGPILDSMFYQTFRFSKGFVSRTDGFQKLPEALGHFQSTKLDTKHPYMSNDCVKGIQICSIEGPCPSPLEDNCKQSIENTLTTSMFQCHKFTYNLSN